MNRKNYLISLTVTTLGILLAYFLSQYPFLGGNALYIASISFAMFSIILIFINMKNRILYLKIGKGLVFTIFFVLWFFVSFLVLLTFARELQGFELLLLTELLPVVVLFLYSSLWAFPITFFVLAWQLFFISNKDDIVQGFWNK